MESNRTDGRIDRKVESEMNLQKGGIDGIREAMNTGKNGTNSNQTFLSKTICLSVVYSCLSYRKKRGKFSLKRCFGKKRGSCGCVSSFLVVVAWWDYVEASLMST